MIVLVGVILFAIALLAIVIQFFSIFYTKPIQASIRTLVGLIVLLVGAQAMPSLQGTVTLSLDWGAFLAVHSDSIKIQTGESGGSYAFAWLSITLLLAICLFRAPVSSE